MRLFLSLLLFLFFAISSAQEIVVLDRESGQPIFNVAVFNKDKSKSLLTGFDGEANLSVFSSGEIIFFRHVSHAEFHATKKQILDRGSKVYLEPTKNELDEVVLSVSKFEQERNLVPQKVVTINQKDILTSAPQTSADLLESTGQVYIQKSQLGGGSPMIRGFATNRLLITVDGVRMNTAIFRGGNVQNVISVDPLSVERTEVVLGPGSIIFGSDAIGGVINFFTLTPAFSVAKGGNFSGRAYTRYATANEEKSGHLDISYGRREWSFLTSASYSDFGHMRMGSHGPEEYLRPDYAVRRDGRDFMVENKDPKVQKPTGYEQLNLLQKIRFKPTEEYDFSLGIIYSTTSNFPRYDRLYRKRDGVLRAAEWYYGPQEWLQTNLQLDKVGNGRFYDEAKFTAAYQYFEESRNDRGYGEEVLFHTREKVNAYSLNLDFEKKFRKSSLFYGGEYVFNRVNSAGSEQNIVTGETNPGASRYPDNSSWESLAAYSNFQWELNPELTLQTGARYNYILLDATFDEDTYDFPFSDANLRTGALTGSAGLNWQPNDILGWQLNFSTAFRAPNIDDVGKIFDSAPGLVVVPNPNLEPEKAYNAELGLRLNFDRVVQVDLAGYYTLLEDALVRRDFDLNGETTIIYRGEPSRVQAIQNSARARVYGFETGAKIRFSEKLKLTTQISVTEGEEEQDDGTTAPLRHAAPFFGNVHLVWENNNFRFDLFTEYNGEISAEELAPSERDKAYLYALNENGDPYAPEWYTLNFSSQYQLGKMWIVTASLENITDQRYRTYSSGVAAAGRNLILALQYSF
ncbi:TonB-dependent receptor [Salinimicrobium sediminilitoris]|uniref:TonB-dependent receptor n=1 Tax=Salinimicrobium sediminilitoris TaxID=2876715 RepID=UPI001E410FCA|nr:TonB-dependent receptor [Salinimicrobium sediminilitoris]MCC8359369.1 TonB-dependent receptor [Salinimicrobium sediminilitoris]